MTEKDTRMRLIEAATPLFALKGYTAVSIRELSTAAEVNSALITYHFGSKEGLYEAVLQNQFGQVDVTLRNAYSHGSDPVEQLRQMVFGLVSVHQQFPYIRRFMFSELSNPSPYMEKIIKNFIKKLYTLARVTVEKAIEQGRLREGINPTYVVIAIAGTINFYFLAHSVLDDLLVPDPDQDHHYTLQVLDLCFHGMQVREEEKLNG